jgi:hypothetical protein
LIWSLALTTLIRKLGRHNYLLVDGEHDAHARVLGEGTGTLKFTSGKTIQLKNVQHVPTINKNLVRGSLLCRDGFKLVFESNKCIISKFGTSVGKGYDSGGLFHFSLLFDDNVVNHVMNDESNVWHSRLCHVNFGCMMRLASLSLIPSLPLSKILSVMYVLNRNTLASHIRLLRRETWHL